MQRRAEMQGVIQWSSAVVSALTRVEEWEWELQVDAGTEKTTFASYVEMRFWCGYQLACCHCCGYEEKRARRWQSSPRQQVSDPIFPGRCFSLSVDLEERCHESPRTRTHPSEKIRPMIASERAQSRVLKARGTMNRVSRDLRMAERDANNKDKERQMAAGMVEELFWTTAAGTGTIG
ncbi:hypothetical protein BDP55DRAFT_717595 [Colletotrichum godetiae]|uniref:Uncharacterized protein n=1 Tax=Colletotrichum godetiae TaxID=1209918 RepID=A0AAJ0EVD8_9PEZI|nr:uncharacterized protein BDP55DRAFT_717595 [Colletotrichum godetiae]KAK1673149.1 hypothetical protein BDP55DRAFT_717595 [Colletotrichum godetiae]